MKCKCRLYMFSFLTAFSTKEYDIDQVPTRYFFNEYRLAISHTGYKSKTRTEPEVMPEMWTTKEEWRARMEALKQNARDPYPDTQEGRRAYEADMTKWHVRYGDANRADETRPYPLTPGTLPVGQGECFWCGRDWHGMNNPCPANVIPLAGNQW